MIDTVLFDLDGTLLPMEQNAFMKAYFAELAAKFVPLGYNGETLIKSVLSGTKAMVLNDGSRTNFDAFWTRFAELEGEQTRNDIFKFNSFYEVEFDRVKRVAEISDLPQRLVRSLKTAGYSVILATNPMFPAVAVRTRLGWLGLTPEDFDEITTYEGYHYCKPSLGYYREILEKTGSSAERCLMVGNNAEEDMCVAELGMDTFLVTDFTENEHGVDTSHLKQGSMEELELYINENLLKRTIVK